MPFPLPPFPTPPVPAQLDMLNDAPRNAAYAAALRAAVERAASRAAARGGDGGSGGGGGAPLRVLDIGTGTGLLASLAALAARAAGTPLAGIDACELHPPMAAAAEGVLRRNGLLGDPVSLHAIRSDELPLRPRAAVGGGAASAEAATAADRYDLLVSEILDSSLLGEGVIPSLRDARERLLAPDAVVVPAVATVWGMPVECAALRRVAAPCAPSVEAGASPGAASSAAAAEVVALHWAAARQRLPGGATALAAPRPLLRFDFEAADVADSGAACAGKRADHGGAGRAADGVLAHDAPNAVDFVLERGGRVDALVVWFELDFLGDEQVTYSMHPPDEGGDQAGWEASYVDHWKQEVFLFGGGDTGGGLCMPSGETLTVFAAHGEIVLHFAAAAADAPDAKRLSELSAEGFACEAGEPARLSLDAMHDRLARADGGADGDGALRRGPTFGDAAGGAPWRHALLWWYEATVALRSGAQQSDGGAHARVEDAGGVGQGQGQAPSRAWSRARVVAAPVRAPALKRSRAPMEAAGAPGIDREGPLRGGPDLSFANEVIGAATDGATSAPLPVALWQLPSCELAGAPRTVLTLDPDVEHSTGVHDDVAGGSDGWWDVLAPPLAGEAVLQPSAPADCIALWVEWDDAGDSVLAQGGIDEAAADRARAALRAFERHAAIVLHETASGAEALRVSAVLSRADGSVAFSVASAAA